MTNTKENINNFKLPNLPVIYWLLIRIIFLVGVLCLSLSRQVNFEILSQILELMGSFLVIAVPVELIREFFFEKINRASFVSEVSKFFDDKIDAELIQARKFGLGRIENSLPVAQIFNDLQQGDTLWWLDTFCAGHKTWIESAKQAIQRGAPINMLILDPTSSFCVMRATEIGDFFTNESFTDELRLFIKDFEKCRNDFINQKNVLGHLDIVTYNNLLGVPCYIVTRDGKPIYAYSSMYLSKSTSINFPHFNWEQGPMCEYLYHYVKGKYDLIKAEQQSCTLAK